MLGDAFARFACERCPLQLQCSLLVVLEACSGPHRARRLRKLSPMPPASQLLPETVQRHFRTRADRATGAATSPAPRGACRQSKFDNRRPYLSFALRYAESLELLTRCVTMPICCSSIIDAISLSGFLRSARAAFFVRPAGRFDYIALHGAANYAAFLPAYAFMHFV